MNDQSQSDKLDHGNDDQQRLLELLSDRALFGLSDEEQTELEALQAEHPHVDDQEMDRIVALLEAAPANDDEMPDSIKQKILGEAHSTSMAPPASATAFGSGSGSGSAAAGRVNAPRQSGSNMMRDIMLVVVASAATLFLAAATQFGEFGHSVAKLPTDAEAMELLKANATDLVAVSWAPTDEATPYSGDVVWSSDRQAGYMTFRDLPVNDPTQEQYQLWIFDKDRNDAYPVDGGVFNITGTEAIVPIDPKIRVDTPVMFAITVEQPGGVVVSDRSRLPLLAKL